MEFGRFQDFLSGLVARQRELFFSGDGKPSIEELLEKLMGSIGEVSGMLTARQVFDSYNEFDDEANLTFFENLENNYNANEVAEKLAYETCPGIRPSPQRGSPAENRTRLSGLKDRRPTNRQQGQI